ncbi:hypothetical protein PR202_ga05917 [Eleusine coracana subsp. coracana]|uniref:Peptidase A1 domain-containing protein n=1 Tax=Eleusine coracana subsp. coracana TaxID=191504 RepID=A0AAV5BVK2_ELECO|nr:hypothetical protein PR202_ga05917 [Eleusine coracana subsp. coracana]
MALHGHLLLSLLASIALAAAAVARDRGTPIDLVPAAPGASLAERARDDRHRHAYITSVLASRGGGGGRRRVAAEVTSPSSSFSMPLTSGAYSGTGQFLARVQVGTPPQQFLLVADTGSDLTWVKCHGGGQSPTSTGNVFRPADSKTWAPIPCSSDTCKLDVPFSLAKCPSPTSPCTYDYKYKEASASARGVAGTETATVGAAKLDGVVVGCTATNAGESFASAADGVLSLGYANISFATRAASRLGGGRFAYCLVDHLAARHVTGYLAFGCQTPPPKRSKSNQTPVLLDPTMPFYTVTVESVHVAGAALDVPGEVWDAAKGGGVILDSGTTLTVLAAPAYKAVVAAISERLAGVPRVRFDPFEYCYNWTSRGPEVPKLAVRFAGSAVFEPPGKSYVIDAAPGIKCIGVQQGEWPGVSVFGNILQQEHLWEFDLKNQWVSFMPSSCTK